MLVSLALRYAYTTGALMLLPSRNVHALRSLRKSCESVIGHLK
jgi:hypothetical protein